MSFQWVLRNTDVQATEHYVIKDPFCVHWIIQTVTKTRSFLSSKNNETGKKIILKVHTDLEYRTYPW